MLPEHLGLHGRLVKRISVIANSKVVDPESRFQLRWAKGKVVRSGIVQNYNPGLREARADRKTARQMSRLILQT